MGRGGGLIIVGDGGNGGTSNNTGTATYTLPAIPANWRYLVTGIHVQLISTGGGCNIRLQENGVDVIIWTSNSANFGLDLSGIGIWRTAQGATLALVIDADASRTATQVQLSAVVVTG